MLRHTRSRRAASCVAAKLPGGVPDPGPCRPPAGESSARHSGPRSGPAPRHGDAFAKAASAASALLTATDEEAKDLAAFFLGRLQKEMGASKMRIGARAGLAADASAERWSPRSDSRLYQNFGRSLGGDRAL